MAKLKIGHLPPKKFKKNVGNEDTQPSHKIYLGIGFLNMMEVIPLPLIKRLEPSMIITIGLFIRRKVI